MYTAVIENFLQKILDFSSISAYAGVKAWRKFNMIWDSLYK